MSEQIAHIKPTHSSKLFDVQYFNPSDKAIINAQADDLYFYTCYVGHHNINISLGDCVFYLSDDKHTALLQRGPSEINSKHIATVIRGYMPDNKSSTLFKKTSLPYVNGCSTRQVFPPERLGDPTLQLLHIPPYTSEQAHHIHSTVRIAYILKGRGKSVVGMKKMTVVEDLFPGKTIILEKMCPHHFETNEEELLVLPLHVFSSVGQLEFNHPMYNGTHIIDNH